MPPMSTNKKPQRIKLQMVTTVPFRTIHNNTKYNMEEIRSFHKYGGFLNEWRDRFVEVFKHPDDPEGRVLTIGANYRTNTFWLCDENMESYAGRIKHNDWRPYK